MAETGYARFGDLEMYYEVHGSGPPLLLAHGAHMTVDAMAPLTTRLAEHRRVVAVELEGHGRTADADRPLTYEQMADDTAALARHLELGEADFVGFSMGAAVGLQLAIRHPDLVRRLVAASASFASDGMHAAALELFASITPEMLAGTPMETEYLRLAPNPGDFPVLVKKLETLLSTPFAWPEVREITAPTMIIVGDSDVVRLEHAVELFGLLGGGVPGDLSGLPRSQLAVLPGTAHYTPGAGVMDRVDWMMAMMLPFLDPPQRAGGGTG